MNKFRCNRCGSHWTNPNYLKCTNCGYWNVSDAINESERQPTKSLFEYSSEEVQKLSTGTHWDFTFGNGLPIGAVFLIGGVPGAGKSTMLLELVKGFLDCQSGKQILYVSSEENGEAVRSRAIRLGISELLAKRLFFVSTFDAINLETTLREVDPTLVIVDSLQGMSRDEQDQLEFCNAVKNDALKKSRVYIVTSQVNKNEDMAGLMATQHEVDGTFELYVELEASEKNVYLEAEEVRFFSAIKNRYGPTPQTTVWRMGPKGMRFLRHENN